MVDVVKMCPQSQHKHRTEVVMKPHLVSLCPPGLIQVWPPLMCNEVTIKVLKYQGQYQGKVSLKRHLLPISYVLIKPWGEMLVLAVPFDKSNHWKKCANQY